MFGAGLSLWLFSASCVGLLIVAHAEYGPDGGAAACLVVAGASGGLLARGRRLLIVGAGVAIGVGMAVLLALDWGWL